MPMWWSGAIRSIRASRPCWTETDGLLKKSPRSGARGRYESLVAAKMSGNVRKCRTIDAQAGRSDPCAVVEPNGGTRRPCRQNHAQNALSISERSGVQRCVPAGALDGIRAMHRAAPAGLQRSRFSLLKALVDPTTPAAVKVRAADSVLDHAVKALEVEDIAARLAELERAADAANRSRKR